MSIATHLIALVIILMTQHKNELRCHAFTVFCPLIKAVKDITGPSPTEGEKSANYGSAERVAGHDHTLRGHQNTLYCVTLSHHHSNYKLCCHVPTYEPLACEGHAMLIKRVKCPNDRKRSAHQWLGL